MEDLGRGLALVVSDGDGESLEKNAKVSGKVTEDVLYTLA